MWQITRPMHLPHAAAVAGVTVTGVAAATAVYALWRHHFRLARVAGGVEVSLVLWLWAIGQFPYLIPNTITIRAAAAPSATLEAMSGAIAAGVLLLVPSLRYLLRLFSSRVEPEPS
jgi:cytochrome d ubiquinol oxidase subunit II